MVKSTRQTVNRKTSASRVTSRATRRSPTRVTSSRTTRTVPNVGARARHTVKSHTRHLVNSSPRPTSNSGKKSRTRYVKDFQLRSAIMSISSEKVLFSVTVISAACIALAFLLSVVCDPARVAKHALDRLAKNYYVEYLYPSTLGNKINEPATVLANYAESGLPTIRLRQLLRYNDGAHANEEKNISNSQYNCNTNTTTIRYFPVAPYGPHDYTFEYDYSCQDLRAN